MFRMENIAESLKKHRKKMKLTQKELAEKLFVSTQSVSKWERGEALPDIAHLWRLAEIFCVSVDVLLGNDTPKEKTLIGVDGGGTKTEFILINEKGTLLKRVLLAESMLVKGTLFRETLLPLLDPRLKTEVMTAPQIWGALLQCAAFCGFPKPDANLFLSQYHLCLTEQNQP